MLRKAAYVALLGVAIAIIGVITLRNRFPIGPVVLVLAVIPLGGLLLTRRPFAPHLVGQASSRVWIDANLQIGPGTAQGSLPIAENQRQRSWLRKRRLQGKSGLFQSQPTQVHVVDADTRIDATSILLAEYPARERWTTYAKTQASNDDPDDENPRGWRCRCG